MDDPRKTVEEANRKVLRIYTLGYYDGILVGGTCGIILGLGIGMIVSLAYMYNQRLHTALEVSRISNLIKEALKKCHLGILVHSSKVANSFES